MLTSRVELGIGIICATAFLYLLRRLTTKAPHPPLPPGPRGLPFVGNALQVPSIRVWEKFAEWGQEYGDIMSITVFGDRFVIINSAELVLEILEAKGVNYAERLHTPMLKLSGWTQVANLVNPGKSFKQQRTLFHKVLGTPAALGQFHHLMEEEPLKFLQRVLDSPDDLAYHVRHAAGSLILKIGYGYDTLKHNDPLVAGAQRSLDDLSLAVAPATWLVDFLPFLSKLPDWFPGTNFKKLGRRWTKNLQEITDTPYEFVKNQMAEGIAPQSFVSTLLNKNDITPEEEYYIKWTTVALYMAGADTTVSAIRGFFLAMALYPDVFNKARAEIDLVVGNHRLPLISDKANLPYTNAIVSEVLRWNVVTPIALPHKSTKDDIHAGYFIPKGTAVVGNAYFMLRDPRDYKDPERFNPERFLGNKPERDPRHMAFGFGRRLCPGRLFSDDSMFITYARSIAALNIEKKVKDGVVIEPMPRMTPGIISHPEPYEIHITPRSAQAISLVKISE